MASKEIFGDESSSSDSSEESSEEEAPQQQQQQQQVAKGPILVGGLYLESLVPVLHVGRKPGVVFFIKREWRYRKEVVRW